MNYQEQNGHIRIKRKPNDLLGADNKNNRSNPNSQLSHSSGHWKKYIAHEELLRKPSSHRSNVDLHNVDRQYNPPASEQISNFKSNNLKKEEMMRRVKQIQNRVMPILKADTSRRVEEDDVTWHNKLEQKVLKLETNLDCIQKQMQIQIEKRILETEAKWEQRFEQVLRKITESRHSHHESDDYEQ